MRHGLSGNKFGRNQTLRAATVRDLSKAVLTHDRITTTRAKAQEARKLVDKLITMGKKGTLAAKRQVFSILCDHTLVSMLFNTIAPRFASRHGGYTRIIKFALNRGGDNAQMVLLELTEKTPVTTESKVVDAEVVDAKAVKETKAKKAPAKKAEPKTKKAPAKKAEPKTKKA